MRLYPKAAPVGKNMKELLKNIGKNIGTGAQAAWKFLSGKKRLIAIGCGLLAHFIPEHTVVGQSATWVQQNLDYIDVGLQVAAGLFGTTALLEHGAVTLKTGYEKDSLPNFLTKTMDKIPDSITGIKGSKKEN